MYAFGAVSLDQLYVNGIVDICKKGKDKKTPFWDEIIDTYDVKKERIQEPNYQVDLVMRKMYIHARL